MSNRTSNINQNLRKESLMICFREAIQSSDARDRRTDIGNSLRLADMNSIDGLEVLFKVLKEKYEPMVLAEIQSANSLASPQGASTRGVYKCRCGEEYNSIKGLNGHGYKKCTRPEKYQPL